MKRDQFSPTETSIGMARGLGTVILLCNLTMGMAQPWTDAGYRVVMVDPQHEETRIDGLIERISDTIIGAMPRLSQIIRTERVVLVFGFPPCTDVAVSGAKHFGAKRAKDPHFQAKAALVAEQCRMLGMAAGCPWGFENPISVFSSIFGNPQHIFHPWHFTALEESDNYTKSTCLWTGGGFVMPDTAVHEQVAEAIDSVKALFGRMLPKPRALERLAVLKTIATDLASDADEEIRLIADWYPDDRIHKAPPGAERANFRSATPAGFSKALFKANAPHLRVSP